MVGLRSIPLIIIISVCLIIPIASSVVVSSSDDLIVIQMAIIPSIWIQNNSELANCTAVSSGSGTYSDPYIIQNFEIGLIEIRNVNTFFIVRNVSVKSTTRGITLMNVSNGIIEKSNINDCYGNGILIQDSENITVKDNRISNNYESSILYSSVSNLSIIGNKLSDYESIKGVAYHYRSFDVLIKDNVFYSTSRSIYCGSTGRLSIEGNAIEGGYPAIYAYDCEDARIENNHLTGNFDDSSGIICGSCDFCKIENNTINGYSNGIGVEGLSPRLSGNIIEAPGSQSYHDVGIGVNVINGCFILNNQIKNFSYGIDIWSETGSGYVNISQNEIESHSPFNYGINVWKVNAGKIFGNKILGSGSSSGIGILSGLCQNLSIEQNHIKLCNNGITLHDCSRITISGNQLEDIYWAAIDNNRNNNSWDLSILAFINPSDIDKALIIIGAICAIIIAVLLTIRYARNRKWGYVKKERNAFFSKDDNISKEKYEDREPPHEGA